MQMFEEEIVWDEKPVYRPGPYVWAWVIGMALTLTGFGGYLVGLDTNARLANESYTNASTAKDALEGCIAEGNRALHEVLLSDVYLWQRIVQLPPIQADR